MRIENYLDKTNKDVGKFWEIPNYKRLHHYARNAK